MTSDHLKSKKGTQLLFYMAIARHTTESVEETNSTKSGGICTSKRTSLEQVLFKVLVVVHRTFTKETNFVTVAQVTSLNFLNLFDGRISDEIRGMHNSKKKI